MQEQAILYDARDGIAEIRLNRPHRLNAVTQELYDQSNDALGKAESDTDVRVVLLTGEGRAFCVGADLKAHKAGRTAFERRQYLQGERECVQAAAGTLQVRDRRGERLRASSLSDLSDRSEPRGRARTDLAGFEAHSGTTQRKAGRIWTAVPPAQ